MKKNNSFIIKLFVCCAVSMPFFSCNSLQTEVRNTVSDDDIASITEQYELQLVALDGRYIALRDAGLSVSAQDNKNSQTNEKNAALLKADAQTYIVRIQRELASSKMSRPLECRLRALLGRAFLLAGSRAQAEKQYADAAAIEADDMQVIILALRLEDDYSTRLEQMSAVFTDEEAPLQIEQALALYYIGQYAKAAASFDAAFASFTRVSPETKAPVYRKAYGQMRDTSWLLQDSVGTVTADSTARVLTAEGMLLLIQSESNLLLPVTGGRILKAKDIARKMEAAGMLDQDIGLKVGDRHYTLYRSDVARVMWKLYVTYKNKNANVDYAAQYAGQDSPVADVPVEDVCFVSVAGCVENELMDFPDGVHFFPQKTISGPEFIRLLKKVDK